MIALACDHAAIELKKDIINLLDEMGLEYNDFGTNETKSCDYPIYAARAARAVASGQCERGIIICGTGIGMSIAANKVPGIRCVACSEPYSAKLSRMHNNSNILALGARVIGSGTAVMIARTWLETQFEAGRHKRRVDMISLIENGEELE